MNADVKMPESRDPSDAPHAWAGPFRASGLRASADLLAEPEVLRSGWWFVLGDFAGRVHGWRFTDVVHSPTGSATGGGRPWRGPQAASWRSSLSREEYISGVVATQAAFAAGRLEQVNLCRVLSAPLGDAHRRPSARALAARLAAHHPATYAAGIDVAGGSGHHGAWLVGASPELFLRVAAGRVSAAPVKGTAPRREELAAKDHTESRLVAEAMRSELAGHCRPGSVRLAAGPELEELPGLVQLVAPMSGELSAPLTPAGWRGLLGSMLPPASVAGLPRAKALGHIASLEPHERGPYCGIAGWLDADTGSAELAVTIRSFWWEPPRPGQRTGTLRYGTGAGITAGSDPATEWRETALKASRPIALASQGATP